MNGLQRVRLGLATTLAAALVGAGALLLVSQASAAVSGTLTVGSVTLAPGGQATVDIRSNVPAPGLGAWTLDMSYDSSKVSVVSCAPVPTHSACNPSYASNMIRLTGATGPGLMGDMSLTTITFRSLAASGSACSAAIPLTVTPTLFDDATVGNPLPVTVTVTNGSLQCPAAPPAPTATPLPRLVVTGTGSGTDGSSSGWLIALAGVGVALLAGYGAERLRTKQS